MKRHGYATIEAIKCQAAACKHHNGETDSINQCKRLKGKESELFRLDESSRCEHFEEK